MFYTTYYIRGQELKGFDLWSKEDTKSMLLL